MTAMGAEAAGFFVTAQAVELAIRHNINARTGATADRVVATASVAAVIRAARSIFRNELDKMISIFKASNPDFYNGYFAARVIVNKAATLKSASKPAGPTPTLVPGGTPVPTP